MKTPFIKNLETIKKHYTLLGLFDNSSNRNNVEIVSIANFITTLERFGVQVLFPPYVSKNTDEEIQSFLDEKAFDFLETIHFRKGADGKTFLQRSFFLNRIDSFHRNMINANRKKFAICKTRNISFVLPVVKKENDEAIEASEINFTPKRRTAEIEF